MDPEQLTQKTQEALHDAQTKALRYGHTEVDVEHLLLALIDQPDGLVTRLLERMDVDPAAVRSGLEAALERRPRVSGSGASSDVRVTRNLSRVLESAVAESVRMKDEYVSVEHVLLAIIDSAGDTAAGRVLQEHGVTRDRLLEVLTEVRGAQRVTSAMPEAAYEALAKYGRPLAGEAPRGQLAPALGRHSALRRVLPLLSRPPPHTPAPPPAPP